jgi:small-conductance mechanosensitive channel
METVNELLQDIKYINQENIIDHTNDFEDIKIKIKFYDLHNLQEEKRIAEIKLESMTYILADYKQMYNDIIKLIKT